MKDHHIRNRLLTGKKQSPPVWLLAIRRLMAGPTVALVLIGLMVLMTGLAYAAATAVDDECQNGSFASPNTCTASADWASGNAVASKAHYREGDTIPYRIAFSGLTIGGTYTMHIQYDTSKGGKHAIDYITDYNATMTLADPCAGIVGCSGSPSNFQVPADPNIPAMLAGHSPAYGHFTMFNGTITGVSYGTFSGLYTGDSTVEILVAFTAGTTSPTLAWGGHISSELDWGVGNSAINISGSPYHTNLNGLDTPTGFVSTGAQDMQLAATAVGPVPTIVTSVSPSSVFINVNFHDTATLTGSNGTVTGSVKFFLCGPTATNTPCTSGGTLIGSAVTLASGSATSANTSENKTGQYCFRVEYTNDGLSNYSPGSSTTTTNECVTVTAPTAVTLSSFKASAQPSGGLGQISVAWSTGSEINTAGFNLYRSESAQGPYVRINSDLIPASNDALAGGKYQYLDSTVVPGRAYYYQLEDVEMNGTSLRHTAVQVIALSTSTPGAPAAVLIGLGIGLLALAAGGSFLLRRKARQA